jgi:hypothetical protein
LCRNERLGVAPPRGRRQRRDARIEARDSEDPAYRPRRLGSAKKNGNPTVTDRTGSLPTVGSMRPGLRGP